MISIDNLHKNSGSFEILKGISCRIQQGESVGVIGPSGSGKSTLLRCINGLSTYDKGEITIHPGYRIGTVFQNFNLFNNLNVLENLTYAPINVLGYDKNEAKTAALKMLDKVAISPNLLYQYPHKLSGGQKQRVAIARTLCMSPQLILLDEPTSSLDPENIGEVVKSIEKLREEGITILLVTHSLRLAQRLTQRILFLYNGKLIEDSASEQFFANPQTSRARNFLSQAYE